MLRTQELSQLTQLQGTALVGPLSPALFPVSFLYFFHANHAPIQLPTAPVTDATIVPTRDAVFNPLPALPVPLFPLLEHGLNELAFVGVVSLFRIAEVVDDDADARNVDISDLVLLKVELGICWIAEAVKMKGVFAPAMAVNESGVSICFNH